MKIKVINPNTTWSMTRTIEAAARASVSPDVEIEAVSPEMGPVSIESHSDEALAAVGVMDEIRKGEADGCDGYVLACFGDPGLHAARELASGPVIGIAEGAFHAASFLGRSFAIVTTLGRTLGRARDLVDEYGFSRACVAYRACEVPVLGLDEDPEGSYAALKAECERTIAETSPDSIVLGCAGMAAMCERLERELGLPVIDGVAAATSLVEAMVRIGAHTSKRDEFAQPPAKRVVGLLEPFSR
ncbi:aspartate/glutamate racemase family protein [Bifidobacterium amazonense]|uniref:Aspartate/glutamate racemase family protein n=1 Tax=Bifidobacterium amazonense TaxID=2809027 RepID=A0ABS9VWT6_9BIFI|nr:aspartate/glutamate racemase family protein [Bifidobacterium amazonense]MCH9276571.1 aspartate/glutamate racemase family protein [Bifidobacterium amazonense]